VVPQAPRRLQMSALYRIQGIAEDIDREDSEVHTAGDRKEQVSAVRDSCKTHGEQASGRTHAAGARRVLPKARKAIVVRAERRPLWHARRIRAPRRTAGDVRCGARVRTYRKLNLHFAAQHLAMAVRHSPQALTERSRLSPRRLETTFRGRVPTTSRLSASRRSSWCSRMRLCRSAWRSGVAWHSAAALTGGQRHRARRRRIRHHLAQQSLDNGLQSRPRSAVSGR